MKTKEKDDVDKLRNFFNLRDQIDVMGMHDTHQLLLDNYLTADNETYHFLDYS